MQNVKITNDLLELITVESKKCTGCNLCTNQCPMLKEYCSSPENLLEDIIRTQEINPLVPYSCALCGNCERVCANSVKLKEIFLEMRKYVGQANEKVLKELGYNTVKFHQKNSFSKVFSTEIKGLDSETKRKNNVIFFPGCSLASYSPDIVKKTYEYLKNKIPHIGITINCCGNPTYSMGDIKRFNNYYNKLSNEFKNRKITEIIVSCQNCYKTIEKNSPDVKVTSLWEIIAQQGIPREAKLLSENINTTFTIHDPCPTRNEKKIHDSIREITKQLGLNIKEMEFSRGKTLCCGSGGMLNVTNKDIAVNQMKMRANQTEADCILSYCQECVESMKRGGKESIHILDILFNNQIHDNFNQKTYTTYKKWFNRFISKKEVDKIEN